MDRYVIREPRGGEYPEGNQMIAFSATSTGNNITIPETMYYRGYSGNVQSTNMQQLGTHTAVAPHMPVYSPNVIQRQTQIVSGIDPIYLAAHSNSNNATYIVTGQSIQKGLSSTINNTLDRDYQNHIVADADNRNFNKTNTNNHNFNEDNANNRNFNAANVNNRNYYSAEGNNVNKHNFNEARTSNRYFNDFKPNNQNFNDTEVNNRNFTGAIRSGNQRFVPQRISNVPKSEPRRDCQIQATNNNIENQEKNHSNNTASKKQTEIDLLKSEAQNQVKTRAEKLKELQKTGTRVFSGPIEKIFKWHKSLQEIGIMVLYEIVGKCVNVRTGESCAKILVVRDDTGPAIQVVYYEIDFFLPELKPPCTVRIIGRMLPGTNRLQAFNVRPATGDDVATLPRRAAVAAHHVANLCKEYGVEVLFFK